MSTSGFSMFPKILAGVLVVLFALSLAWLTYINYQAGSEPGQLVSSAILLSVPLGLLYFSIGVLGTAVWQRSRQGQIDPWLKKALYRTPRIAGVLITLFVGLFALDVFAEGYTLWEMIVGFLIHASPSIVMAIVLALAWRREWIGFVAFLLVSLYFLRFMFGSPMPDFAMLLIFSGPMLMIALLFGANWRWRKDRSAG